MRTALACLLTPVLLSGPAAAQSFTGTYTTRNDQGGIITLTLEQGAGGAVSGTLSGNGNTFRVQGELEGNSAVGAVTHPQIGGMYFQADLAGDALVLILVGIGADNEPDYNQTQELRFTRQATVAAGGAAAERGGMGAALGVREGEGTDPWVGTWSGGTLTVTFEGGGGRYTGTATVQGTRFPLTGQGGATQLSGTYVYSGQSFPWQAQLQNGVVTFHVDGRTVELTRGRGAAAGNAGRPAPTGGAAALSAAGQEWHQWIAGKRLTQMDSYYSGPAYDGAVGGGYSSKKLMDVCSDGRFFYSGSSLVGVGGAGVSGYSAGDDVQTGRWRIIEQGGQVGLELTWQDGSLTQHLLEYRDSKTFVDGTRTFVTEDNQSCP